MFKLGLILVFLVTFTFTFVIGRGEDSTEETILVQVPQLHVTFSCTVDDVTCGNDVITLDAGSVVKYDVSLTHTESSTGVAYNVVLQLYVPLYDLLIVKSNTSYGVTEASGLGVKLTVATLSPTEGITWHTELLVRDHVTFSDCSTAIVSMYDISESASSAVQMLPILINFFTLKQQTMFPHAGMYDKGILGSLEHPTLYICNTTCYALLEDDSVSKLNSDIHSLIGLTVAGDGYTLYGISRGGAYVISTSLDNWIAIPPEIWTGVQDKESPLTGPWPETVRTSRGLVYTAKQQGVFSDGKVVFTW